MKRAILIDTDKKQIFSLGAQSFEECRIDILKLLEQDNFSVYNVEDMKNLRITVDIPVESMIEN